MNIPLLRCVSSSSGGGDRDEIDSLLDGLSMTTSALFFPLQRTLSEMRAPSQPGINSYFSMRAMSGMCRKYARQFRFCFKARSSRKSSVFWKAGGMDG